MRAAVQNKGESTVLAVTVLTSIDDEHCKLIYGQPAQDKVLEFALLARAVGMDGVICSPHELQYLTLQPELAGFSFVTPGVRPEWAATNDQKRVMTPGEAIKAGATALVIGRPITRPPANIGSPVEAVGRITQEIEEALNA